MVVAQIDGLNTRRAGRSNFKKKLEDYWDELTRTIDKKGLAQILQDEKTTSEVPTLYISAKDKLGITYFQDLEKSLKILKLKFCP
jgi:alpha,alpha-trehalase